MAKQVKIQSSSPTVRRAQFYRRAGYSIDRIAAAMGIKPSVVHALLGGAQ